MEGLQIEKILEELTLEEKANLCSGRDFWKTQDIERLGIPSVMMCDGPNGLRKQLGCGDHLGINESIETVCYPTESAIASSFDTELIKELGEILGEECQAEDVSMLLGPGVNIKRSPMCGRNFEYFSEDPWLTGEMAASYIRGLQSRGVSACVKHFAANNQETRRMSGSSNIDERTLHEIYLPAFKKAVQEGKTRGVMCAYNAINGTFCAENKSLLTDILRTAWGYEGFVVTDWGAVKNRVKGLLAGLDLEMPGATEGKTKAIVDAVESGELPIERLNRAVYNILKFVSDSIARKNPKSDISDGKKMSGRFDREKARKISRRIAEESAVLLKNDDNMLPLHESDKVTVTGEFAENPRYQGAGSSHVNVKQPVSFLDYAAKRRAAVEYMRADVFLSESGTGNQKAHETVVVFAGLPESYETEGCDRETMNLPEEQNTLIELLCETYENVVVVLHGGSVMAMPWRDKVRAILLMHLSGDQVGAAVFNLLYGKVNPSGKLAETWPMQVEDNPSYLNFPGENGMVNYSEGIFVGYRYYDKKKMQVQYPFGYGLSYTCFRYDNIRLSKTQIAGGETVTVSVDVTNTGERTGKEIVQLYVHLEKSRVNRPLRELKGFKKTELKPGERKQVVFDVKVDDFAYYEPKIQDWFLESGTGIIEIGASSRDLRAAGKIEIKSQARLPLTVTWGTSIGELMQTEKGRKFVNEFMAQMKTDNSGRDDETDAAMGEGSEKMRRQMMFEMPLGALVSYGVMTQKKLEELIGSLNEGVDG